MRHVPLLLLTLGLLAGPGGAARGADPGEGHKKVDKVKVTDTKHNEHRFDLNDPAHREKLNQMIVNGEVESLQADVQKDLLELRWDLGFWTVIVFILLFLILRKAAWGPMLEGLEKREQNIQLALVEAKEAREEARKLKDDLAAERKKAAEEVAEKMAEARRDAEHLYNEKMAEAKTAIQADRDRVLRELRTEKDQALQELFQKVTDLATLVSSKALRRKMAPDDHRRLVDEAIAEMGKGHQELKRIRGM